MTLAADRDQGLFISLGYLRPLLDHLQARGIDLAGPLELLGIGIGDLVAHDLRLPDDVMDDLFDLAVELSGDEAVGLHAGSAMQVSHLGILGHLMLTSGTTEQVIALQTRYQALVGNGALSRYEYQQDCFKLIFERVDGLPGYSRNVYEYNLAGWLGVIRSYSGRLISPLQIDFPTAPPALSAAQEAWFGCPVQYGQTGHMVVRFPVDYLELALYSGDPELRAALERTARERLRELQGQGRERDPLVAAIRQYVAEVLVHGAPTIEDTAARLDLSVRKLQRLLEQSGTSHKELVDRIRSELADQYVRNQQLSLVDVALMLGFSEQSSFQRAFRRWFDQTPGEFRRSLPLQ